jgi:hypothetical protein
MLSQSSSSERLAMLSAMPRSSLSLEKLVEVMSAEPEHVALQLARKLESQRRKELLLADPYFREQTLLQTDDYWVRLTQSWTPPDWPLTRA